ncbi:hypothetical protein SKAU_G00163870 [Synaphobranchus kaupii]|uniref:Uncharacterized protein n=1 Tax=Synaphobranchus kaupii TaxID=118154 RepID=A0A9Q1FJJ7_SYNKA|nr:hypothetical protein SKAU_G00163870 [Synaphobranchus kaupii]
MRTSRFLYSVTRYWMSLMSLITRKCPKKWDLGSDEYCLQQDVAGAFPAPLSPSAAFGAVDSSQELGRGGELRACFYPPLEVLRNHQRSIRRAFPDSALCGRPLSKRDDME